MVQPLLLRPQDLRQVPALPDDRGAQAEPPAWPCYRSEAFAEDLLGDPQSLPARRVPAALLVLLCAAPLCAAAFGGAVALLHGA